MDYIVRAVDGSGSIKISAAITTDLVEKARQIHGLSKTATAALGRTLTAGLMMGQTLKNNEDSISINIKGDGKIGRIVVSARNNGKIKGYVDNPQADVETRVSDGKLDVGKLVGKGSLTVVTDLGLKKPYIGQVELVSGEIAEDIANYFYVSDQIPSVVSLGVLVDIDYTVRASGGFILQLLPGADEDIISRIENNIKTLSSVTEMIDSGSSPEDIIKTVLKGFEINILDSKEVYFSCDCSEEKVKDSLIAIGKKELEDILHEDKKIEVNCHFCNTTYTLDEDTIRELIELAK